MKDEEDDYFVANSWSGKGRYFELGIGSFRNIRRIEKTKQKRGILEGFAGIGFARIRNQYEGDKLDVNYLNVFVQDSASFSGRWIDFVLTPRITYMNYTKHDYAFQDPGYAYTADKFFQKNRSKLLFEPGITIRGR